MEAFLSSIPLKIQTAKLVEISNKTLRSVDWAEAFKSVYSIPFFFNIDSTAYRRSKEGTPVTIILQSGVIYQLHKIHCRQHYWQPKRSRRFPLSKTRTLHSFSKIVNDSGKEKNRAIKEKQRRIMNIKKDGYIDSTHCLFASIQSFCSKNYNTIIWSGVVVVWSFLSLSSPFYLWLPPSFLLTQRVMWDSVPALYCRRTTT